MALRRWSQRGARLFAAGILLGVSLPIAHLTVRTATRIDPPAIDRSTPGPERGWTRTRAGLREVYLQGSPETIGAEHARLLRGRMVADEGELWEQFARRVPWWVARVGLLDWGRLRYRQIDRGIPPDRLRELAAEGAAFDPDPFAPRMSTYQRLVFLHSLYDIALPLEHTPLLGCTSFALEANATADGHVLFARAFDFEAGDAVDRDKAVFLVREDGAIPFASVAWPGFVGVVTGVNAEGVAVVVHGARAREPGTRGIPVAFSLREALARAHDTDEAVEILRRQIVLVSHIVFVADARGRFAVVERAPGVAAYVRISERATAVTNHFEGPLASDARDLRVRRETTTIARRARVDELLYGIASHTATPGRALEILRDHACPGDEACPLGDRRAIDALIAAHGIVADLTDRALWVGIGPNLSGKFVRLDLRSLLSSDHDPGSDGEPDTMAEDRALHDGRWDAGRARAVGGGDR